MDIKRRDFLKGLMAIAGVAAVGLPQVEDSELIADIEQFLEDGGEPAYSSRPAGPYGSICIGDRWYALHYAMVDVHQNRIEIDDGFLIRRIPTTREWLIECELDNVDGIDIYDTSLRDIELDALYRYFTGQAFVVSIRGTPDGERFSLDLRGSGPLAGV